MTLFLTINQMLSANLHLGHTINFFDTRLRGILVGLRKKIFILNINMSLMQYQLISNLILNMISKRHPIFIIKNLNYSNMYHYITSELSRIFLDVTFYDKKWFGGTLTNYRSVLNLKKFGNTSLFNLKKHRRFPSMLCIFDSTLSKWALLEGYNLKIPTISLIDTDSIYYNYVNYPIISNNKNINSSFFFLSIICNSIKLGRKKELAKIMQLKTFNKIKKAKVRRSTFSKISLIRSFNKRLYYKYLRWIRYKKQLLKKQKNTYK